MKNEIARRDFLKAAAAGAAGIAAASVFSGAAAFADDSGNVKAAEYEGKKILALCVPCEGQLYFFAAGPCAEENEDLCEEILNSVSLIWDERQDP